MSVPLEYSISDVSAACRERENRRRLPQASYNLAQAIHQLGVESIRVQSTSKKRNTLRHKLEKAGLTGPMPRMKEMSLNFYLDPIDASSAYPSPERKAFPKFVGLSRSSLPDAVTKAFKSALSRNVRI